MTYRGGCHCGRVAFEVDGELAAVGQCNCSICSKKGYLHWIVEPAGFRLLTPEANLTLYSFNTKAAKHYFCPACGIASFYIPRSDPNKIDVNVRCLEGVDISKLEVYFFDGRNWEEAHRQGAHTRFRANQADQD
ncbi:MAG TPA: GFA family protein [Candidatus Binataceae bacterium]|nr:GFA family protein [Candidatus Binataceae bacterium]